MFGWDGKRRAERVGTSTVKDGKTWAVYRFGRYTIEIDVSADLRDNDVSDDAVTYRTDRTTESRPHVEITDDQVCIDVTDLCLVALDSLGPEVVASHLWREEEVRRAFLERLTAGYSVDWGGVTVDSDIMRSRREFLAAVQERVWEGDVHRLAERLTETERGYRRQHTEHRLARRILDYIRDAEGSLSDEYVRNPLLKTIIRACQQADGLEYSGYQTSTEARDHWRRAVERLIARPPEPQPEKAPAGEPAADDGVPF